MGQFLFTVFTPTYNRAHTLARVFDSLREQTCRDFEWLIVDDGSLDNTESLVKKWQQEADFRIRYFFQENGGKHRAFNRAVGLAEGDLFLPLDSDDACIPTALERFRHHWEAIGSERHEDFSGVTSLCMTESGEIVGSPFPAEIVDSNSIEMRNVHGITGEKWGFCRTDILRRHPYPEIQGEKYIAPSFVWNQVAKQYLTRYVNEALRIYELQPDSVTLTHARLRARNPEGSTLYYNSYLAHRLSLSRKIRTSVNYVRFALHGKTSVTELLSRANAKLPVLLFLPIGFAVFCRDRRAGYGPQSA